MNWKEFGEKALDKSWDAISDFLMGGLGGYFFTHKLNEDKQPLVVNGKPVMTIDTDKVRAQAPYFVADRADESEFNGLVVHYLDRGSQKNLEIQMGQIPAGPYPVGQMAPGLGNHQRADVILNTVQLNTRKNLPAAFDPREDTRAMLQALADISDPAEWKNRAVAFRLMKANESDYLGAQLTEQAAEALRWALRSLTDLRTWSVQEVARLDVGTNAMRAQLARHNQGWRWLRPIRRYFRGLIGAFGIIPDNNQ